MLLISAVDVAGIGLALDVDHDSPFLFPATLPVDREVVTTTTLPQVTTTTLPQVAPGVLAAEPSVYDPFGDESERVFGTARTAFEEAALFELQILMTDVAVDDTPAADPIARAAQAKAGTLQRVA